MRGTVKVGNSGLNRRNVPKNKLAQFLRLIPNAQLCMRINTIQHNTLQLNNIIVLLE